MLHYFIAVIRSLILGSSDSIGLLRMLKVTSVDIRFITIVVIEAVTNIFLPLKARNPSLMPYSGGNCVLTGASGAIGASIAKNLLRRGYKLYLRILFFSK